MAPSIHHRVVVIGGGTAGISVAARLRREGVDVGVIEPSATHDYQPFWTLVGAGIVPASKSRRTETSVMPDGVDWIRAAATGVDAEERVVHTTTAGDVGYDVLVVSPGIQLDWDEIPGLEHALGRDGVSSNYTFELAPRTWDFIRSTRSGTAVFTMPSGPIKCAGAPQKIAYLACDHWRREGVLDRIDVHLVLPTPAMFGIPVIARELDKVVDDYGIEVHFESELASIDPDARTASFTGVGGDARFELPYDLLHAVPPQSAPDWVKKSPLSTDDPTGYVEVDPHTLQHVAYPDVFALGDAGSSPNSKTGAAVRKQAPVVVANVLRQLEGGDPTERYEGYASCPLVTSRSKMLLAEFGYSMEPTPSIPLIDTLKPRRDMWYLKRYGLPFLYWNLMLKGRA
jgi:sulfide:quinone oxidoreductase